MEWTCYSQTWSKIVNVKEERVFMETKDLFVLADWTLNKNICLGWQLEIILSKLKKVFHTPLNTK